MTKEEVGLTRVTSVNREIEKILHENGYQSQGRGQPPAPFIKGERSKEKAKIDDIIVFTSFTDGFALRYRTRTEAEIPEYFSTLERRELILKQAEEWLEIKRAKSKQVL